VVEQVRVISSIHGVHTAGLSLQRHTVLRPGNSSKVGSEVVKSVIFWDLTPCSVVEVSTFRTNILIPSSGLKSKPSRLPARHIRLCLLLPSTTVFWDVTPCSIPTFRSDVLPPFVGSEKKHRKQELISSQMALLAGWVPYYSIKVIEAVRSSETSVILAYRPSH
jgi:hypothetical protein